MTTSLSIYVKFKGVIPGVETHSVRSGNTSWRIDKLLSSSARHNVSSVDPGIEAGLSADCLWSVTKNVCCAYSIMESRVRVTVAGCKQACRSCAPCTSNPQHDFPDRSRCPHPPFLWMSINTNDTKWACITPEMARNPREGSRPFSLCCRQRSHAHVSDGTQITSLTR